MVDTLYRAVQDVDYTAPVDAIPVHGNYGGTTETLKMQ